MKRVLLVTNDYPPKSGGIQQYLGSIASRLDELLVLAPAYDVAEVEVGVARNARSFMWPTRSVRKWVAGHVETFQPDVVVFGAPYPLAWIGRSLGVPYIVMTHGAEAVIALALPVLSYFVGASLRGAQRIFAVSDFTAHQIQSRIGDRVSTLGAGVDLDLFSPSPILPTDPMVIGCVSRFVPRKGHRRVILAADELYRSGVNCEVLIVGSGRLERRLRRQAAKAAVPVRFEIDVAWDALPGLYREMSVFVMPATSRWAGLEIEGLGIVYLEAAASGLPVIAGPSGGAPETVQAGVTGFVASSVNEITERLRWFADDRDRLVSFGAAGRRWAEESWSWDAVMLRFQKAIDTAVRQ